MSLADVFRTIVAERAPVAFRGYDGSATGPADAVAVIEARSPAAVSLIARAPGQLGLARAYVTGALEIHGDMYAALRALMDNKMPELHGRDALRLARWLLPFALRRQRHPAEEASGRLRRGLHPHSKARDASAISHHYDVSNHFYELVLGPTMAYSCAVFPGRAASLEQAQEEKFDLVCRKLDLRPGQRLLDFGAGWGGLVIHAARRYGVSALGITLSRAQVAWASRAITQAGLEGQVEMRLLDYRDLGPERFDAIASIGAMEHVGSRQLASYFSSLADRLTSEGRFLNHAITFPSGRVAHRAGAFFDRYVFPDGELQAFGTVVAAMHDNGLEVRHAENLREHYAMTLRAWGANLDRRWQEAVDEVGERRARVWRLYMALSRVAFDLNQIEVHQLLGVRLSADGRSGMPLRPDWERPRAPSHNGEPQRAHREREATPLSG